jgi:hypothetical protein
MLPCYPGECNLENVHLLGEFYHKWLLYKYGSHASKHIHCRPYYSPGPDQSAQKEGYIAVSHGTQME